MRHDLKMGTGKLAAQCCHAAVELCEIVRDEKGARGDAWRTTMRQWRNIGAKKIAVKANSEKELYVLH